MRKQKNQPENKWYTGETGKKVKVVKQKKKGKFFLFLLLGLLVLGVVAYLFFNVVSGSSPWEAFETDEETLRSLAPINEEMVSNIEAMPVCGEDETWAIYLYMTGSDLESDGMNELSDLSKYLIYEENERYETKKLKNELSSVKKFVNEVTEQGVDLPQILYSPTVNYSVASESSSSYNPDMEGSATSDLAEITGSEFPDNLKVVVQTGGAKRWQNSLINPNRSQRFLIDAENSMTQVYDGSLVNMGKSSTLTDFISFCVENYPADHKILVFWDHGGATGGICYDEIFDMDHLTLDEVSEGIENAVGSEGSEPYFDVIGFDACLMSCAEVAHTLCPYTQYIFASEESEPGSGWAYESLIGAFTDEAGVNAVRVGKALTDGYIETCVSSYAKYGYVSPVTFSIIDAQQGNEAYLAYCDFCKEALKLVAEDPSALSELSRAAQSSIAYCGEAYKYYNTIDLGIFMQEAKSFLPEAAEKVLSAIDKAALYVRSSSYLGDSTGLSIYFPARMEDMSGINKFLTYINDVSESDDINALYYYKVAGCLNDSLREYAASAGCDSIPNLDYSIMNAFSGGELTCLGDGNMSMKLDAEELSLAQTVRFGLAKINPETDDIVYYGEDGYAFLDPDGSISTNFSGKWLFFDGYPLPLEVVSETDEEIMFRTPISYNGLDAWLMTGYNAENDEYTLLGIREQLNEAGTAGRSLLPLKDDASILIYYDTGNLTSNATSYDDQLVIYKSGETKLEECPLQDGTYYEYIILEDLRSDTYCSPIVSFTMNNGKITNQAIDESVYFYEKQ